MTRPRSIPPPIPDDDRAEVSQEQIAYWWRISIERQRVARASGALPYHTVGRYVRYVLRDVEAWREGKREETQLRKPSAPQFLDQPRFLTRATSTQRSALR